jgi:hypothetical protein
MFTRYRKRLVAWLTLICVAFASLSPAVAAATGNRIDKLVGADICSTVGTKTASGTPAQQPGAGHEVNCFYCLSGAMQCPPPTPELTSQRVTGSAEAPVFVSPVPRTYLGHTPGAPRAPPFTA